MTLQAVLCWSEYYNGKWQPAKTSNVNLPTKPFQPDWATSAWESDSKGMLFVSHARAEIIDGDTWPGSFLFYNTHSLPVRGDDLLPPARPTSGSLKAREKLTRGTKFTPRLPYSELQ